MEEEPPHFNKTQFPIYTDYDYDSGLDSLYSSLRADSYPNVIILSALLGILFLIGTVGNSFVVVVFARSFVKHNSTYLILTLAVVDLTINLVNIPGVLLKEWYYPFRTDTICRIWELFQMATIPISALILVAIAFDRYFLICKAFKGSISIFWAKLFLVCAVFIGFVLGIPPMLAVGVYQVTNTSAPYTSDNLYYIGLCAPNYLIIKSYTLKSYWNFLTTMFILIIMILTTLYIFIFLKVYKQSKKWNNVRKKPHTYIRTKNGRIKSGDNNDQTEIHRSKIRFQECPRCSCFFKRHSDENRFDNRNSVFLVTVTPIENLDTSCNQNECTAMEQLTPELNAKRKNSLPSVEEKPKNSNSTKKNKSKLASGFHEKSHRQKKAHIKTAYVLCVVTLIYIVAYLPTFLITHNVISGNIFLFYFYFIHSASNPVIYSFMNLQFRNEIRKLFTKAKLTI